MRRLVVPILAAALVAACASSVPIPKNQYGLEVVDSIDLYRALVDRHPDHALVPLERFLTDAKLDIRYATGNNFMNRQLYPIANPVLRLPAARALARVERELASEGLGLVIFDAYRPYRVTEMMWEPFKDPDYVADPAFGSRHNRGAAVDLTLYELETGALLEMGTDYDEFVPAASHGASGLDRTIRANRETLRSVMERHGFDPLPSEWWHYDFRGWDEYPLMDIPLDLLR